MAISRVPAADEDEGENGRSKQETSHNKKKKRKQPKPKELGVSCMLNTEVGAVLAVIRRPPDPLISQPPPSLDDCNDSHLIQSLKSLRSLIFHPHQNEWNVVDPAVYLGPFLDVIQSDNIPAFATGAALSAVLKILTLDIFDEGTPGAREAIHSVVLGITNCRLERTDPAFEDAILLRVLQVLSAVLKSRASILLTDTAVCTVVNSCFQVIQQSKGRGDLLQRSGRHAMHEMIQVVFSQLPEIKAPENVGDGGWSESEMEDDIAGLEMGYGARCMVDIFHLLCSLMNVVEVVEAADGSRPTISDEDVQLFALILINSAVEFGGEAIDRHPKLLRMIQDDLFHHLIHYGMRSSPLVLSMICSTVLNLYHFLRRSLRLQLEAFFTFVLLRTASRGCPLQLQEVAIEGINSFCRQPNFVIEMYINFDCDPTQRNVFEDIGKYLCKIAFPVAAGNPLSPMQIQAFEALVAVIGTIAENIDIYPIPDRESYQIDDSEYEPFWVKRCEDCDDLETWVRFIRMRKLKKKKVMIAGSHFNIDGKKGLDFLKLSHLVPRTPDPQSLAYFYRYTPGLDKTKIGEFLGDPDEFYIKVLKEYTETFDFTGVILDTALRTYLETFRLPGESQKIERILEAFSERFFENQSSEIFTNKDAVHILCYSLIMLNTDQHNPQVKKKMTEEEFIRNNRAINDGKDLPREYLSELFYSISTNAITLSGQSGSVMEMNTNKWIDLIKRSRVTDPYILCDFEHKISRDVFTTISGPLVAALSAIFEHTDDEEILHECVGGLLSIARIARYGLEDILDELLTCFCKFTTLLNPYSTVEETLFTFSHDLKPRMATLAIFTIANKFGESIRGGWRNVVDCLLKLQRLKLLPQSVIEPADSTPSHSEFPPAHTKTESGVIFPSSHPGFGSNQRSSGLMGRFSQILSMESTGAESMANIGSEFENNLKIIQQCHIGNIFGGSSGLPDESLQNLVRALIFAAGGKGQRFSTPVEEEETVGFCWELLVSISLANLHRFSSTFWPQFHGYLIVVSQFPLFSPCPFAEKAINGMFKVCLKLLLSPSHPDKTSEELIFKSINLMWKLDKEILDTCSESLNESTIQLLTSNSGTIQTMLGWKTLLHLLSVTGRHPETYDQSVDALMTIMSEGTHITRYNYPYWIDAAFGFAALKISPLEKSTKILDLMVDSVNWLIQWHKSGFSDPGSNMSNSSIEDSSRVGSNQGNLGANLFLKLIEALRKTSLVRREEIRSHAMWALRRCFAAAEGLDFTPSSCIGCFNHVIFAMVDDLHEKLIEYSRRENSEREMKSMECTLKEAMELLVEVYLQFLTTLSQSQGFRTFWLGVLRRMDTCMKAETAGEEDGELGVLKEVVPELLKKMITEMKEKEVLVQREGDDLWDITNIQIQWIAPSMKEELFPEEEEGISTSL